MTFQLDAVAAAADYEEEEEEEGGGYSRVWIIRSLANCQSASWSMVRSNEGELKMKTNGNGRYFSWSVWHEIVGRLRVTIRRQT